MEQGERRIRSLRLSGHDDVQLLQARYRLEEAFRTASFPGLPPNGQVLVRRLDLGTIRTCQSPVMLAGKISELVRGMAAGAIHINQHGSSSANVIWFKDQLEPYTVLLHSLLSGKEPTEWYWQTLFPSCSLKPDDTTIERIFTNAITTPMNKLAPALLVEETIGAGLFEQLLSHLTVDLVNCLFQLQGLNLMGATSSTATVAKEGEGDTQIIAPNLNVGWRIAIQESALRWGEKDIRTLWVACNSLFLQQSAWLDQDDVASRVQPSAWLESWGYRKKRQVDQDIGKYTKSQPTVLTVLNEKEASVQVVKELVTESERGSDRETSQTQPEEKALGGGVPKGDVARLRSPEKVKSSLVVVGAQRSEDAGIVYLIPLLQRIGFAELLAANEQLLEVDLPRQLFWSVMGRFATNESDPMHNLFVNFVAADNILLNRVVFPHGWYQLTTSSGRPLKDYPANGSVDIQLFDLLGLIQLVASCYLRRFCNISLRSLIKRCGNVSLNTTHWDVFFPLDQVDLRLRRVALDCDPGWVSWLGRVVVYHFDQKREWYV